MKKSGQLIFVMVFVGCWIISCSRYDSSILSPAPRIIRNEDDSVRVYSDSIIYIFNSRLIARADKELFYPIHFRINLPGKWEFAKRDDLYAFGFLYDEKQAIFIWTDMYGDRIRKGINLQDTLFRVGSESESDLDDLLFGRLSNISIENHFDVEKNGYDKSKETFVIRKGAATILLYNIKKEQITTFLKTANSFEFIK